MKEKRYRKQEKGITLIALIITIIVMLILVAVTVQMTINGGIFEKAGEAVGKTKNSMNEEEEIMDKWVEKIDRIENGPNAPELIEGMIPVEWNETEKTWVKADETKDDWYEYGTTESTKKWANAVTVKAEGTKEAAEENLIAGSKTREQYQKAETGTSILQEDILGMYVWIPRYAYKITKGYHEGSTDEKTVCGEIDVKFIGGTKDTISDGNIVAYNAETTENFTHFPDGYVIHPAFNVETGSGIKRLSGIWIAKFEASSSNTSKENENLGTNYGSSDGTKYSGTDTESEPTVGVDEVTVRPNVTSWRNINVKNCYIACTNMVKENNIQGLSTSADSHLMKDTEWGAVAYLIQSEYGNQQKEDDSDSGVWNNSYYEGDGCYGNRTGMIGSSRDDGTNYEWTKQENNEIRKQDGVVTITYKDTKNGDKKEIKTFYEYWTSNGVKGSTTGTIYGIYDMAGGAWEYQASCRIIYMGEKVNTELVNFFNNVLIQHKTIITEGTSPQYLVEGNGNARIETGSGESSVTGNSWNDDNSLIPGLAYPFSICGGRFDQRKEAGVFSSKRETGDGGVNRGFRPVLWKQ